MDIEETTPTAEAEQEPIPTEETTETAEVTPPEPETEEVIVSIGDPEPTPEEKEPAPAWVKQLRKDHRALLREKKELEAKLAAQASEKIAPDPLGKKPTIEDFDYDPERYEAALEGWYEKKRRADEESAKAREAEEAQKRDWQSRLEVYETGKKSLPVTDFEDAEIEITHSLNQTQQGIIVQGAENPAALMYALYKTPGKLKELAEISDPVRFAFAVAKLESQVKITKRTPPPPEKIPSGSGRAAGAAVDSQLERLREEAEKSGDYSKVLAYKRQKKNT